MLSLPFLEGFAASGALIVAIGAQNAFVLRQGIKREHVLAVVLVCAASDALLVTLGIAGLSALVQRSPNLLAMARYGGAAFLITVVRRKAICLAPGVLPDGKRHLLGRGITPHCLATSRMHKK